MKKILLLLLIFSAACKSKPKEAPVSVKLINNGRSVKFQGIDDAILGEISRGAGPEIWQSLLPVYRLPADTDMKDYQQPQPGTYKLQEKGIVFTPDTPFIKGQAYYVRYYHFDEGKNVWDIVKNKRKLGNQPFTDLEWRW